MKREIEIIDGSDESSYFSIMPVRILNFEDTGFSLNVDEMHSVMISIEEEDVFEPHPVKRTMKNYKIFPGWQLRLPAAFLRREVSLVLLHRRQDAEIALYPACVVVVDVTLNHANQLLLARKTLAIIPLALQDAPETLHRPIVDTVRHAGHTLRHACLFELVVKCAVRVLEASVAVEQRMRVRVGPDRLVEGFEHQRIVVALADDVGDDASVIQVQNGAEIELVHLNALVPFELRDVGKPLLVRLARIELAVKQILGDVLRILRPSGAAVVAVLDRGLDARGTADAKDSLVVDVDVVVMAQLVVDPTIALIRALHVDLLHLFGKCLVLCGSGAQLARRPLVIRRA